jgi:nucleotide-binding universal stress UspA family protein
LESAGAIKWSYDLASSLGADVHVVAAWQLTTWGVLTPTKTGDDYWRDAQEALDKTMELAGEPPALVNVHVQLFQHDPAEGLVEGSKDAMMLVVGSHSYGPHPTPHRGSVASYCAHHAQCPVVVYRMTDAEHEALKAAR